MVLLTLSAYNQSISSISQSLSESDHAGPYSEHTHTEKQEKKKKHNPSTVPSRRLIVSIQNTNMKSYLASRM